MHPKISSYPSLRFSWRCTVTPWKPSDLPSFSRLLQIVFHALRTPSLSRMFSCTPPTSDLWVIVSEFSFTTTGYFIDSAVSIAFSTVSHTTVCTTGMP